MTNEVIYPLLRLKRNPFISIPIINEYETQLHPLFCAREKEVENLCSLVQQTCAIFLIAPYGGGKTVILLEAFNRLREIDITSVYSSYRRERGFRGSILNAMITSGLAVKSDIDSLDNIISTIRKINKHIVIGVDDLDRANDIDEVTQATNDIRELLSEGVSVIVSGQPFGVTFDLATSAGGIFHDVKIPEFSKNEFKEMLEKYLQSVHLDENLPRTHPFDEKSANFICNEISEFKLTPRLFNYAVFEIIVLAKRDKRKSIPIDALFNYWPKISNKVIQSLKPLQIRHMKILFEGRYFSEDTSEIINDLGESQLAEYPEVRDNILRPLIEKNIIQTTKVRGKLVYEPTHFAATTISEMFESVKKEDLNINDLKILFKKYLEEHELSEQHTLSQNFIIDFFMQISGFVNPSIISDNGTDEFDIGIEINNKEDVTLYGKFSICKCVNCNQNLHKEKIEILIAELRKNKCRFGIFIAVNGVKPDFHKEIQKQLRNGFIIALLTKSNFLQLEKNITPSIIIQDSYYYTLEYSKRKKVFISYSHDSERHRDMVLSLANQLCEDGIDCFLDQYEDAPTEGWTHWMNNCINDADFVLLICTEAYYNRVMGKEKKGIGLGGKFEGKLIHTKINRDDSKNKKFLPVLFDENHNKFIPDILQDFNYYVMNSKAGYETLFRRITGQQEVEKPVIRKQKVYKPKSSVKSFFQSFEKEKK